MPQRRRTTLTLAVLAALAGLSTAGAAGCDGIEIDVPPGALSAPVSIAPVPSASAGQPRYVCTAVHKILTDGAFTLAQQTIGGDTEAIKNTFAGMAADVTAAAGKSTDAAQRAAAGEIAAALTEGSRQSDPRTFIDGEFGTIGQKLDGTCS